MAEESLSKQIDKWPKAEANLNCLTEKISAYWKWEKRGWIRAEIIHKVSYTKVRMLNSTEKTMGVHWKD